jgi:hypothetical protein
MEEEVLWDNLPEDDRFVTLRVRYRAGIDAEAFSGEEGARRSLSSLLHLRISVGAPFFARCLHVSAGLVFLFIMTLIVSFVVCFLSLRCVERRRKQDCGATCTNGSTYMNVERRGRRAAKGPKGRFIWDRVSRRLLRRIPY